MEFLGKIDDFIKFEDSVSSKAIWWKVFKVNVRFETHKLGKTTIEVETELFNTY